MTKRKVIFYKDNKIVAQTSFKFKNYDYAWFYLTKILHYSKDLEKNGVRAEIVCQAGLTF